jgi:hypothetical protein
MSKRTYLDPAYSVIMKFSPTGELGKGIDAVAAVTGADRTRVYRWMRPREKGGTDGVIPAQQQQKLFDYAQKKRLPLKPADFFGKGQSAVIAA